MAVDREQLIAALTEYVRRLERGADTTARAELRPQYRDRLAQAARIFAALADPQPDWARVRAIVTDEVRAVGWSYLPGSSGGDAEAAFEDVRRLLGQE